MLEYQNERPVEGLESFVGDFLLDRLSELALLKEAVKESRFEDIQKVAHQWKGFSEPYGFNHLGLLAVKIEQECLKLNLRSVEALLGEVETYLEIKEEILKT